MTRLLAFVLVVSLFTAITQAVTRAHHRSAAEVLVLPSAAGVVGEPSSSPLAARFPLPRLAHRPHHHGCTATNWRHRLKPAERRIDAHESGLNPAAVEPSTHAFGIGQLLPSTYAVLGLPMSADPCDQIKAQRAYLKQHYGGSWSAALRHKQQTGWW